MPKYKRKTTVNEAFQWTGYDPKTNPKWFLAAMNKPSDVAGAARVVNNDLVKMIVDAVGRPVILTANKNDYILRGADDILFPVKPDAFHLLFDTEE